MDQEQTSLPENSGGHGGQFAARRHPKRICRLLSLVYFQAGKHRQRRGTRYGMFGWRDGPVQGIFHPENSVGIMLLRGFRPEPQRGGYCRFDRRIQLNKKTQAIIRSLIYGHNRLVCYMRIEMEHNTQNGLRLYTRKHRQTDCRKSTL